MSTNNVCYIVTYKNDTPRVFMALVHAEDYVSSFHPAMKNYFTITEGKLGAE